MRKRALGLAVAIIGCLALVSASAAATTKAQKVARIDVSTRVAVVKYLRSHHVNPEGVVIQRGARNYAGGSCLGKGWSCANTRHAVVQIAPRGGQNRFVCKTSKCVVVQFVGVSRGTYVLGRTLQSTAATATNTAKCVRTSGLAQLCAIVQLSSSANNVAVVYEQESSSSGLTQAAASGAAIIQRAIGASNTNTACVYQAISLADSRTTSSGGLNIWLGAHQNVTITQDSAHGGNSAAASATSAGGCTGSAITQNQTLRSTATGHGAITQNENSASLGPNVSLDIEQNQSRGFKGSATGTNSAVFSQTSNLQAVANTPNGPVSQTQSSPDTNSPYSGLVGTLNQDSKGISTASATQTETQCEDAATSGLTSCDTDDADAPPYSLTQTQYGPEGIWKAPSHRSGRRRVPFVHKGYGTATQTGNSGDMFTISQSSMQDTDQGGGSHQTNTVQGDCQTSGNCTDTQNTTVDGSQSTNVATGSNVSAGTTCSGSTCTGTISGSPPPTPVILSGPTQPSTTSTDAAFTFEDTNTSATFLCQLDTGGYLPCSSPQDYPNLSSGPHTFYVEATQNGHTSSPASYTWMISTETGNANVLIAGLGDEFAHSTEPNDNLDQALTNAGYNVNETATLPVDLSSYGQVWWVDTSPPSAAEQNQLIAFEQSGKGVFLTGERPCCEELNTADTSMVNSMVTGGGITVGGQGDVCSCTQPLPVNSTVVGGLATQPNTVTSWQPSAPGGLTGVPDSSVFSYYQPGDITTRQVVAAAWDRSSTVGSGRLVVFVDINWSMSSFRGANWSDVADNVAFFLSGLSSPPSTP